MNVNLNIPYKQLQGFSQNRNELAHYGVKGMKWGQCKRVERTTFARFGKRVGKNLGKAMKTSMTKIKQHQQLKKQKKHAKDLRKGKVQKMNAQELKDHIARLQMQKQYKDLKLQAKRNTLGFKVKQGLIDAIAKQPGRQLQSLFDNHRELNRTKARQALNDEINQRRYQRDKKRKADDKQAPSAKQQAQEAVAQARAKRMLQVLNDKNHPQHYRALFNSKVDNKNYKPAKNSFTHKRNKQGRSYSRQLLYRPVIDAQGSVT